MQNKTILIQAEEGLHARPAHLFCSKANEFESEIKIRNLTSNSDFINAKSILMILTLGVMQGNSIEIECDGIDENEAIAGLIDLVENNFAVD